MFNRQSASAYQSAAVHGATQIGLLQLAYARLGEEMLRAAAAVKEGNIPHRCSATKHALRLLGHLESWVESMDEPELARSLSAFYSMLRVCLIEGQFEPQADEFERLAELVFATRRTWQEKEAALLLSLCTPALSQTPGEPGISFRA